MKRFIGRIGQQRVQGQQPPLAAFGVDLAVHLLQAQDIRAQSLHLWPQEPDSLFQTDSPIRGIAQIFDVEGGYAQAGPLQIRHRPLSSHQSPGPRQSVRKRTVAGSSHAAIPVTRPTSRPV